MQSPVSSAPEGLHLADAYFSDITLNPYPLTLNSYE